MPVGLRLDTQSGSKHFMYRGRIPSLDCQSSPVSCPLSLTPGLGRPTQGNGNYPDRTPSPPGTQTRSVGRGHGAVTEDSV